MKQQRRTVRQLIEAAGGVERISAALGQKPSPYAILKWRYNGVPDRYWPTILTMANATADEMLAANISARTGVDA